MRLIINGAIILATIWLALFMFMLAGYFILSLFGMIEKEPEPIVPEPIPELTWVVSGTV